MNDATKESPLSRARRWHERGAEPARPTAIDELAVHQSLSLHHAADVSCGGGSDHRRHRIAGHCLRARRDRARVLGGGVVPDRQYHRGAGLRPARRHVRPARDDDLCARDLHARIGALRAFSQYRIPHRRPRAARFWRRRPDDAVAGADRRGHSAARARQISGLSRRHCGVVQHVRPGRRRLSHPGVRLAIGLPHQRAARAHCLFSGAAARSAPRRPPPHHLRYAGPGAVHHVRRPRHFGARAGAAHGCADLAHGVRAVGLRHIRAGSTVVAGAAQHRAALAAAAVPQSVGLAQRRAGGLPRRGAGLLDHVPADLSARGPRRVAGGNRPACCCR